MSESLSESQLCALFKALSNPQRLRIFLNLAGHRGSAACDATREGIRRGVGELGEGLDVEASTVSHHLKELRQAGLVLVRRRGKRIECWINEDMLHLLRGFFDDAINGTGYSMLANEEVLSKRR